MGNGSSKNFICDGVDYGQCKSESSKVNGKRIYLEPSGYLIYDGGVIKNKEDGTIVPHGDGTLYIKDPKGVFFYDTKLSCPFTHGVPNGLGTYSINYEQVTYKGYFTSVKFSGHFSVWITFRECSPIPEKLIYEGEFVDGERSGPGTLYYEDCFTIQGDFYEIDGTVGCRNGALISTVTGSTVLEGKDMGIYYPPDTNELIVWTEGVHYVYNKSGVLLFKGKVRSSHAAHQVHGIPKYDIVYKQGKLYSGDTVYEGKFSGNQLLDGYLIQNVRRVVQVIAGVHHMIPTDRRRAHTPPPGYTESAPPSYSAIE